MQRASSGSRVAAVDRRGADMTLLPGRNLGRPTLGWHRSIIRSGASEGVNEIGCGTTKFRGSWRMLRAVGCGLGVMVGTGRGDVVLDKSFSRGGPVGGTPKLITPAMGRQVGGNLFHSFRTFDLAADESAVFSGGNDVRNVIARVTGGKASTLAGDITVAIPGANFYFINPSGVIVAPGSTRPTIRADGAVVVTTAGYLALGKHGRFDAGTPAERVLTAASPSAFGFVSRTPAKISRPTSTSRQGLIAADGKTLSLVGGDVSIHGNGATALLQASGGAVNIISVGSSGAVTLDAADPASGPRLSGFTLLGKGEAAEGALS